MPTSITTAPGLIQDPFTNSGLPTAATTISAVFTFETLGSSEKANDKDVQCFQHSWYGYDIE